MNKSTSQILQEVRAVIQAGWCQHRTAYRHRHCIVGALLQVMDSGHTLTTSMMLSAVNALVEALPYGRTYGDSGSLVEFNDDPRTTKRTVLALFDRALTEVTK